MGSDVSNDVSHASDTSDTSGASGASDASGVSDTMPSKEKGSAELAAGKVKQQYGQKNVFKIPSSLFQNHKVNSTQPTTGIQVSLKDTKDCTQKETKHHNNDAQLAAGMLASFNENAGRPCVEKKKIKMKNWSCVACTMINKPANKKCHMCEVPRSGSKKITAAN